MISSLVGVALLSSSATRLIISHLDIQNMVVEKDEEVENVSLYHRCT